MLSFEEIGRRRGGGNVQAFQMFPLCVWVMHHLANIINLIMEVCVWKSMRWEEGLKMFQLKQTKTNCLVLLLIGIIDYD